MFWLEKQMHQRSDQDENNSNIFFTNYTDWSRTEKGSERERERRIRIALHWTTCSGEPTYGFAFVFVDSPSNATLKPTYLLKTRSSGEKFSIRKINQTLCVCEALFCLNVPVQMATLWKCRLWRAWLVRYSRTGLQGISKPQFITLKHET